ncbi:transposase [Aetokthonos hydrillicola Thurmond2011]|uniref:Transposase n=1 Tax=Aetokthonos hydrillicola Thurmond2011 TaxID=2712845 RepID=A0AAP5M5P8_9CYAN|nr:RNA-guided endonuclease TnpB family protein [Aetokthonos hydrillicola]MBO3458781.1 IS200/IS605 family element transposase accessory protein TnpB [Aetokthonos hydrillicola CCALA 1050]MBW4585528.1 transposase [Aetokthonos hydrillicola CCALA 1050]MDR9896151.1 transposase [Aetokthonos hydrillicola Thurmond2011]
MLRKVVKVRIYPDEQQQIQLAQAFGCSRWWWNYALNKSIETYKDTGKGLSQSALNALLPGLKKAEETIWLGECYSQILQATTLNLTKAYKNFFEGRAKFPRFKSKKDKQSIQYPQSVKVLDGAIKLPGNIGEVKAVIHRAIEGIIKTVTVSKCPSGKYFAAILFEVDGDTPEASSEGDVIGIDLGLKHFAVVSNGEKVSKFENPKHIAKHEKNLKRKQQKLARKKDGSKSRFKAKKLVAKVHERLCNSRQDFLQKLSTKLANDNQVVVVENLNTKGMVRNHNLAKAISDAGWGMFTNFLAYKLERKGGAFVEIDRWFPSSKLCSNCFYQMGEMPLDVREWTCPHCGTHHDRDGNAAHNIRAEGIRILKLAASQPVTAGGNPGTAVGGEVSPKRGRKSKLRHTPMNTEAPSAYAVG